MGRIDEIRRKNRKNQAQQQGLPSYAQTAGYGSGSVHQQAALQQAVAEEEIAQSRKAADVGEMEMVAGTEVAAKKKYIEGTTSALKTIGAGIQSDVKSGRGVVGKLGQGKGGDKVPEVDLTEVGGDLTPKGGLDVKAPAPQALPAQVAQQPAPTPGPQGSLYSQSSAANRSQAKYLSGLTPEERNRALGQMTPVQRMNYYSQVGTVNLPKG